MTTTAIVMMTVSLVLLWGGLFASIWVLARNPEPPEDEGDGAGPAPFGGAQPG